MEERLDALHSFHQKSNTFCIGCEVPIEVVRLRNRHIDDVIEPIRNLIERTGFKIDGNGNDAVGLNLCSGVGVSES
ncbi:unannotated protein [freshwater metagenome]|uniref:Unannotated protein n=1 Tax=freshwater metagenome TaxID=449393 RepID=A0A6J6E984_9ZZZZ